MVNETQIWSDEAEEMLLITTERISELTTEKFSRGELSDQQCQNLNELLRQWMSISREMILLTK